MDFLVNYYQKKGVFTYEELREKTRAPCIRGINERPSYFVLLSNDASGYQDILDGQVIWYDGFGRRGNQRMVGENLRLKDTEKPLLVFNRAQKNEWVFVGNFKLAGKPKTVKDCGRTVFKFPMIKADRGTSDM